MKTMHKGLLWRAGYMLAALYWALEEELNACRIAYLYNKNPGYTPGPLFANHLIKSCANKALL